MRPVVSSGITVCALLCDQGMGCGCGVLASVSMGSWSLPTNVLRYVMLNLLCFHSMHREKWEMRSKCLTRGVSWEFLLGQACTSGLHGWAAIQGDHVPCTADHDQVRARLRSKEKEEGCWWVRGFHPCSSIAGSISKARALPAKAGSFWGPPSCSISIRDVPLGHGWRWMVLWGDTWGQSPSPCPDGPRQVAAGGTASAQPSSLTPFQQKWTLLKWAGGVMRWFPKLKMQMLKEQLVINKWCDKKEQECMCQRFHVSHTRARSPAQHRFSMPAPHSLSFLYPFCFVLIWPSQLSLALQIAQTDPSFR